MVKQWKLNEIVILITQTQLKVCLEYRAGTYSHHFVIQLSNGHWTKLIEKFPHAAVFWKKRH